MSKADEVVLVENNNEKFPSLKKIIMPQCEQLCSDLIEVVTGAGAPHEHSVVEENPTKPWAKLHNGLWDPLTRVFRGYDAPAGSKITRNATLKALKDILPVFEEKIESGIKKN